MREGGDHEVADTSAVMRSSAPSCRRYRDGDPLASFSR